MTETRSTTLPLSEWEGRKDELTAEGWMLVAIATFSKAGRRMARVKLMKDDEG